MATSKSGSVGILLENCDDVRMTNNRFFGLDTAVHAINSRNIHADSNIIVPREIVMAIAARDKTALIAALGLPTDTPSPLVGEALQTYSRNAADERTAAQELSNSRLARYIGVAADLSQLGQAFAGLALSPMLAEAISLLFS